LLKLEEGEKAKVKYCKPRMASYEDLDRNGLSEQD